MPVIGFHNSHEQIPPAQPAARRPARRAGRLHRRDVLGPLRALELDQGHSGFAWSWLGAALATTKLPFGVVNAPGQRYHPAIIAQASRRSAEMFPGRFWVALGSGEAINEHITGDGWPRKEVRDARLRECVDVIRALLAGEEVSHDGPGHRGPGPASGSCPSSRPPLIAPAVTVETARRAAEWADGLVTVNQPHDHAPRDDRRLPGRRRPRAARPPGAPVLGDPDADRALAIALDQWRSNVVPPADVLGPRHPGRPSTRRARTSRRTTCARSVRISTDLGQHAAWIAGVRRASASTSIYLHYVGQEQRAFIDAFGEHVLPQLRVEQPEPAEAS